MHDRRCEKHSPLSWMKSLQILKQMDKNWMLVARSSQGMVTRVLGRNHRIWSSVQSSRCNSKEPTACVYQPLYTSWNHRHMALHLVSHFESFMHRTFPQKSDISTIRITYSLDCSPFHRWLRRCFSKPSCVMFPSGSDVRKDRECGQRKDLGLSFLFDKDTCLMIIYFLFLNQILQIVWRENLYGVLNVSNVPESKGIQKHSLSTHPPKLQVLDGKPTIRISRISNHQISLVR